MKVRVAFCRSVKTAARVFDWSQFRLQVVLDMKEGTVGQVRDLMCLEVVTSLPWRLRRIAGSRSS